MSKPLHPKASGIQRAGLFAGLKSFDELETRIAALPDERARGDTLEVFAEAYLATQRRHDLPQVWPLTAVPTDVLRKLALPLNDYGVDGVAQTALGGFDVYQVKFRSGRQPLTWRELSTFMGLADSAGIHSRVLFTNCDDLPAVMNERKGFFCIRGSDLDRLEGSDFRAIESWLAQAHVPTARKQPDPHQHEALDVLLPALREHDRVTAIMACGTGKTLVALWIAERTQSQTILVLLPSLALLRQTLHEWLHETSLPSLAYLCVCSDPTVKQDLDAIATSQSDLDFPVTTDRRSVREFLDASFAGAKIIFSTYQSARVVGEALRENEFFDLGIFDEAHKTAGREGRNYALALEDSNLPIRKRLFLTATPRHYNPQRKDKEGDAQLVFSMDKPQVYGEQAYRLTFAEAARRGIICNYKVVISVITSGMITNELLSRGEVLVNGDPIRARQVANQIAVTDAIAKYGVNKVFTFHRTVKSAQSFVAEGAAGIGTHLSAVAANVKRLTSKRSQLSTVNPQPINQSFVTSSATNEFQTFHVNGTMQTARREREMRDFRTAARAVMSNARCLTEGVDVPAVDMVAFLSPRRSRVDIVQATGRAMRISPGKTTGYVLVPLYVEQAAGETVEAAVSRADFDEVWDVLQSLQEQDNVLAEIIREMREQRGMAQGFDDSRFREKVEIWGPQLSLDALRIAIATRSVEQLGMDWDQRFGELADYRARQGNCNVPAKYFGKTQLGVWVAAQRVLKKKGKLSPERIKRLDSLGFDWNPISTYWETMFHALVEYKQQRGHCRVPRVYSPNRQLGRWCQVQRRERTNRTLETAKIGRLDAIGFVWKPFLTAWEAQFAELCVYHKEHGDADVSAKYRKNPKLGAWVSHQRKLRSLGKLSKDQTARLDTLRFVWSPHTDSWEQFYTALSVFRKATGHCFVPANQESDRRLTAWIATQKTLYKQGKLESDRIRRLDSLGLVWSQLDSAWEEMFGQLERYKREHDDCNVPQGFTENSKLAKWVESQRRRHRLGKLEKSREARLSGLGFVWRYRVSLWERMFAKLESFKQTRGHCDVIFHSQTDLKLGRWVNKQRQLRKAGKLRLDRIQRLDGLDFRWEFS